MRGLPRRRLPDRGRLRRLGRPRDRAGHAPVAQAGRDRRQVRPAGRGRPGGRVPEGVHARADRSRAILVVLCRRRARRWRCVYGTPRARSRPGFVALLAVAGGALQSPFWIFYRRMDFVRQRTLQAVDPSSGFVVTVGARGRRRRLLGARGRRRSPGAVGARRRRARRRRTAAAALRARARCASTPASPGRCSLAGASCDRHRAGLDPRRHARRSGSPASARSRSPARSRSSPTASTRSSRQTLYPAICAVKRPHRPAVRGVREVQPAGADVGRAVRGRPGAVRVATSSHFGFGDAVAAGAFGLIRRFGLIAAVGHIGFNWDAFFRARGETRPIAVLERRDHARRSLVVAVPLHARGRASTASPSGWR